MEFGAERRFKLLLGLFYLLMMFICLTGCSIMNKGLGRSEPASQVSYVAQPFPSQLRYECGQPSITAVRKSTEVIYEMQYSVRDDFAKSSQLSISEQFNITIDNESADRTRYRNGEIAGNTIHSKITMPVPVDTGLLLTFTYMAINRTGKVCNASNTIYIAR